MGVIRKCFLGFAAFTAVVCVIIELYPHDDTYETEVIYKEMESRDSVEYVESKVSFYLYTRFNEKEAQKLEMNNQNSLANSNMDFEKKTIIFAHGHSAHYEGITPTRIRDAYLKHTDYNVIVIDFGELAFSVWYLQVVANTYKVGRYTGRFILFLIDCGLDPRLIHLMGHSIGAHVVGFAGKETKAAGKLIGRITGLDPNNLGYGKNRPEYRLAPDDAAFTDCITTNFGKMGIGIPICQANYFANGAGAIQPGCFYLDPGGGCSHLLVIEYFKESIDRATCTFKVEKCDGIPWAGSVNSCHPTNETIMGEYANTKLTGHFLFGTTRWPPYCPYQQSGS